MESVTILGGLYIEGDEVVIVDETNSTYSGIISKIVDNGTYRYTQIWFKKITKKAHKADEEKLPTGYFVLEDIKHINKKDNDMVELI